MSIYDNETYLQSLNASKGDVDRQVQNALAEIARQRQVAGQQTAKIPGAANTAISTSRDTLNTQLSGLGVTPLASLMQAFDSTGASYGRAAGLLNQGFGEQETRRRGSAVGLQQELLADIQAKANDYITRRQQEDRERAFQQQEAARQRALQEELARQSQAQAAMSAAAQQQAEWQALQEYLGLGQFAPVKAPFRPALNSRTAKNRGLL